MTEADRASFSPLSLVRPGHRHHHRAEGHVRERRRRIRGRSASCSGRALVIGIAPAMPQITEAGRQADARHAGEAAWSGSASARHARAVPAHGAESSKYGREASGVVGTFIVLPIIVAASSPAFFWALFNAVLGAPRRSSRSSPSSTHSQVIRRSARSSARRSSCMQGTIIDGRPVQSRRARADASTTARRLATLPGQHQRLQHLGHRSSTAIGLGVLYRRKSRNIAIALHRRVPSRSSAVIARCSVLQAALAQVI